MKLYASPLQGFTEAPWRNIHHELFGGIDAYYTPFVRVEKGEFFNILFVIHYIKLSMSF